MLKRILFIALFICASLSSFASKPRLDIDLDKIRFEVAQNPAEFKALMNRFVSGDTSLSIEQLAKIYFGYAFTYDYDPTDTYDNINQAYEQLDYNTTWLLCSEALKVNPVSLDLMVKALVAANNGTNERARRDLPALRNRFSMLSDLILATGRGTTPESPFKVICAEDIARIVNNVICVEEVTGQATVRDIDAIKVKLPTSSRQHILYFDNSIQKKFEREKTH
ncbi:MAG: DUF4919 domain-containing protein [Muribaculaceae bacterium]|nr:DUF4919 domain-containing protein [Muribaculaceae bacterium]